MRASRWWSRRSRARPTDGRSVLTRPDDVEPAWQRAVAAGQAPGRVMVETVVDVDDEVTMLTVRSVGPSGPTVQFCEPIGHRQTDGGPLESWQPHQMSPAALDAARSIAARIVNSLGGRGVFNVELLVRGDEVYFTSVRPRPDDVGLVTLRSQRLSQFELHARAILGLTDRHHHDLACGRGGVARRAWHRRAGRRPRRARERRAPASTTCRWPWPPPPTWSVRGTARTRCRRPCASRGRDRTRTRLRAGPAHDRAVSSVRWRSSCSS